jgi:hypothetical protein
MAIIAKSRLGLSTLLIAINVGLLIVALASVAIGAIRLMQQLADNLALGRVEQAGLGATNVIGYIGQHIERDARLLAERPTLHRLLGARDAKSLAPFLSRFQETAGLYGSAVWLDGKVFAQSGESLPWETLLDEHRHDQGFFFHHQEDADRLLIGAWAPVPQLPDAWVMLVSLMDQSFSNRISHEVGLSVTILPGRTALTRRLLPHYGSEQLSEEEIITLHSDELAAYITLLPLQTALGEMAGIVTVQMPDREVSEVVYRLIKGLLLLTGGIAVLAVFISLVRLR